jgi:hypothetical protein
VTENEWLNATDPQAMLTFLGGSGRATDRKLRLAAVACCRRIWHLLPEGPSRVAVAVRERYADGEADAEQLGSAAEAAVVAADEARRASQADMSNVAAFARSTACLAAAETAYNDGSWVVLVAEWASIATSPDLKENEAVKARECAAQADLVRCIFGNPWQRRQPLDLAWLTWNDCIVRRLAEGIYAERRFGDMGVLADALEEAGCMDREVLAHLRSPRPHARGCWVIDLLLAKG